MDKVTLVKQEIRAVKWAEQVQACQISGMTASQWCRENGISLKTYYYYLHRVREKACEQIPVAITTLSDENKSSVTVRNANGLTTEIFEGTSAATIEAVIRALKC